MIEFVLYVFLAVGLLETTVDVGTKTYDTVSYYGARGLG